MSPCDTKFYIGSYQIDSGYAVSSSFAVAAAPMALVPFSKTFHIGVSLLRGVHLASTVVGSDRLHGEAFSYVQTRYQAP